MVIAWMFLASTGILFARYYINTPNFCLTTLIYNIHIFLRYYKFIFPNFKPFNIAFWFHIHRPFMLSIPVLCIMRSSLSSPTTTGNGWIKACSSTLSTRLSVLSLWDSRSFKYAGLLALFYSTTLQWGYFQGIGWFLAATSGRSQALYLQLLSPNARNTDVPLSQ